MQGVWFLCGPSPSRPHSNRECWECATELGWGCIPGLGLHSWQRWLSLGSCGGSVSPVQGRARCPLPVLGMQLLLPSLASGTCLPKAGCAWPKRGLARELELGRIFLSAPSLLLPLALQKLSLRALEESLSPDASQRCLPACLLPSEFPVVCRGRSQAELAFWLVFVAWDPGLHHHPGLSSL